LYNCPITSSEKKRAIIIDFDAAMLFWQYHLG